MPQNFDIKEILKKNHPESRRSTAPSSGGSFDIKSILKKNHPGPSPTNEDQDSLWNDVKTNLGGVIAGAEEDVPFSGAIDKIGAASYAGQQAVGDIFRDPENRQPFEARYHNALEGTKERRAKTIEAAPDAARVGNVIGGATALAVPIPGAGMAGMAGRGARLAGQMAIGGIEKGTQGDELFNPQEALHGATTAGIVGGAGEAAGALLGSKPAQAASEYISGKLKPVGDYLKGLAERKAFKAAVGNQAKAYDKAEKMGQINPRGRELLDSGTVGFGDSARSIGKKAKMNADLAGEEIGNISNRIDEAVPGAVDGRMMAQDLRNKAAEMEGGGNMATTDAMKAHADRLEAIGPMSMKKAQQEKDSWEWKFGADEKLHNLAKGAIGSEMEKGAELASMSGKPGMDTALQDYLQSKSRYGTNAAAAKDANINANRFEKNNAFSLGDKGAAGLMGQISEGLPKPVRVGLGVASALGNRLVRKRGNSAAAVTLDQVGQALSNNPGSLGKYGPILMDALKRGQPSFALTHQLLMAKDPGYQQLIQGGEGQ